MIKKDYILIADLLAKNNADNNLIIAITDAFKKDNKRFSADIFIKHIALPFYVQLQYFLHLCCY